jgi:HlyD family secretion protein
MRPVLGFLAITLVLSVLLGVRLWWQAAELHGPAGGAGVIEGESTIVSARLSARISTVAVKEGQQVEAGAVLVTLDCAEPTAALEEAEARLAMAEAQARAASASAQATKRSGQASKQASKAAEAQAAALSVQQQQAARSAGRLESLGEDVAVDRRESARTQAQGLEQQVTGAQANKAASAAQAAAADDQGHAADANASAASEAVRAAQAAVDRVKIQVGECTVLAPAPGYVETLPWHVGELVSPGAVLARLVDIREVKATFYLPNAEVSAVKAGADAEVVADAYGGEVFKGTVGTVTLTAEFTPRNIQTRSDRDRLVYPVEVHISNADGRLRPGMPVQVSLPGTGR